MNGRKKPRDVGRKGHREAGKSTEKKKVNKKGTNNILMLGTKME